MPIPIAQGNKLTRQFISYMDPKYGYIGKMTDEDHELFEGLLWYNELMQFWQLRSIHMKGPTSWGTEIMGKTMVFEVSPSWRQLHRDGSKTWAFGITFGGNSPYNNGQLSEASDSIHFPSSFATLEALLDGLAQVEEITKRHKSITDIKVRMADPWLVGALAWGRDLEDTAHYYCQDGDVQPLLPWVHALEARLNELEHCGLSIEFWLTDVSEAFDLANQALDWVSNNS